MCEVAIIDKFEEVELFIVCTFKLNNVALSPYNCVFLELPKRYKAFHLVNYYFLQACV